MVTYQCDYHGVVRHSLTDTLKCSTPEVQDLHSHDRMVVVLVTQEADDIWLLHLNHINDAIDQAAAIWKVFYCDVGVAHEKDSKWT